MNEPIRGGYILKARCIEDSAIAHAPPHVREIFDYFLRKAFWQDRKTLKRGELLTSYGEIREALHWMVGWRKEGYTKSKCENAMKYLKKAGMIATRRTTRGLVVSVCHYWRFQNPENYESHSERGTNAKGEPQPPESIDEEGKKERRKEGKNIYSASGDAPSADSSSKSYCGLAGVQLERFNRFWEAFDHKRGKGGAARAWKKLKDMSDGLFQSIIDGATREARGRSELIGRGLTPKMAQGWLTDRRWEDEPPSEKREPPRRSSMLEEYERRKKEAESS